MGNKKRRLLGSLLFLLGFDGLLLEDNDTVPVVVSRIFLNIRTECASVEAAFVDAVSFNENILNGVSTTLRELQVVVACTGVLVSITSDNDLLVGVSLEPLSHSVDVHLFSGENLSTVDSEANSSHERSVLALSGLNFGAGELSFELSHLFAASYELRAEVVNLAIEGSDLRNVRALVERVPAAAADVEVETAHSLNESVNGVTNSSVVPVVAIESCASFSEEVNILAEAETELETCVHGESPLNRLPLVVLVVADVSTLGLVAVLVVEVPVSVTTETYERNDRENAVGVNTTERVEHIPHKFESNSSMS